MDQLEAHYLAGGHVERVVNALISADKANIDLPFERAAAIAPAVAAPACPTIAAAAGEALCLGPVRERVRENVWPRIARAMRIESAALGEELPYRAALCAALEGELVTHRPSSHRH